MGIDIVKDFMNDVFCIDYYNVMVDLYEEGMYMWSLWFC